MHDVMNLSVCPLIMQTSGRRPRGMDIREIVTAWTRASEMAKAKGSVRILPASVELAIKMHLERDPVKSTARCRSCG